MYAKSATYFSAFCFSEFWPARPIQVLRKKKPAGRARYYQLGHSTCARRDISEMQGSERTSDSLSTAQCFYRLPTFSKSVSLEVTRAVEAPRARPRNSGNAGSARAAKKKSARWLLNARWKRNGAAKKVSERKRRSAKKRSGAGTSTHCWSGGRCFLEWQPAQFFTLPPKK